MKSLCTMPFVVGTLLTFCLMPGASAQSIPVQTAEQSRVGDLPPVIEPGIKGFGTRGVEGGTLDEMLDRCKVPAASTSVIDKARCAQLQRTLKTAPGGTLR